MAKSMCVNCMPAGPCEFSFVQEAWGDNGAGWGVTGYCVTGSDPSARAVAHAAAEAVPKGLTNLSRFLVADMTALSSAASDMRYFDVVLALDNALPHFLSDGEVTHALRECYRCLRPCGLCVISMPDYDAVQREPNSVQLHPCGVDWRTSSSGAMEKVVASQTWEWDDEGRTYEVSTYVVFDSGRAQPVVRVHRSRLYAIGLQRLEICMLAAGFERVKLLREPLSTPVLVGFAPDTLAGGPGA